MTRMHTEFSGTTRFELRGRVGQGGMGVVYLAYDHERRAELALKTLVTLEPQGIYRLKREFRSLAELSHPNLVVLHELFSEQGWWFFTMEFVPGADFFSYVRGGNTLAEQETMRPVPGQVLAAAAAGGATPGRAAVGPPVAPAPPPGAGRTQAFDEARLRDALRQLARGVHALHLAGKQHRDLKPANVLVRPDGRVVLLDFGLVTARLSDVLHDDDGDDQRSGTPAYMAPERLAGDPATAASDWYSVGVMLYQALTGYLPTETGSPRSSRESGAPSGPPVSPDVLVDSLPRDLVKLCIDLLRPSPGARPSGAEVLRRLGDQAAPDHPLSAVSPAGAAGAASFVGRSAHLEVLRQAFATLRDGGTPVQVHIRGRSGFGKTALVRRFLGELRQRETIVLAGRCYERETVPYKVFDSLIDGLGRYLDALPADEVRALLPDDVRALVRMFPALLRIPAIAEAPRPELGGSPEPAENARRGSAALKALLGRIAARRPLVLFIDDLQWGDQDSVRVLADLVGTPEPLPALLILAHRSEDQEPVGVLAALLRAARAGAGDVRPLEVGPLSAEEARELALRALEAPLDGSGEEEADDEDRAQSELIVREAAGNPLFVQELARYLTTQATSGRVGATNGNGALDVRLGEVLLARVASLPPAARTLLEAIAVAGRPVPQNVALAYAGLDSGDDQALRLLRSMNLVRTAGPRAGDTAEVYHDRIREEVAAGLPPAALADRHRRIASVLEGQPAADPEALTVHWQGAGDAARAARYALAAARQASEALAFDRAASRYQTALALLDEAAPERHQARVGLAQALRNAGRGPEAAVAYLQAAAKAGPDEELELRRLACEQLLVSGHVDRGLEVAGAVLAGVGLRLPGSAPATLGSLLLHRAQLRLRGTRHRGRAEADIPARELTRVDVCWSMATGLSIIDTKLGADFTTRYLLLALAAGEPRRIARGLAMEAAHTSSSGNFARATALLGQAGALSSASGNDHTEGFVLLMNGFVAYFRGHWRAALGYFDRAEQIFRDRCSGVIWETSTAHFFALWALVYLGDWIELRARGQRLFTEAQRRGNLYLTHGLRVCPLLISALADDDVEGARRELRLASEEWSQHGFQIQHFLRLYMAGWIDLYAGDGAASRRRIDEQWAPLRGSLLLQIADIRLRMLHIRGYSAVASGQPGRGAARDAAAMARIESAGSRGVAAMVLAAAAHQGGDRALAERRLGEAAGIFDAAEMPLYAAAARRRLGELRGDAQAIADADAVLAVQKIKRPDRVCDVLAPGFRPRS